MDSHTPITSTTLDRTIKQTARPPNVTNRDSMQLRLRLEGWSRSASRRNGYIQNTTCCSNPATGSQLTQKKLRSAFLIRRRESYILTKRKVGSRSRFPVQVWCSAWMYFQG